MSLPLQGIRVLDLSRLLPGGFCSLLLADFGAEVLKVEDTGMGDYIRWSPPYYDGAHESARSALFLALNRNKRSIRLDLKSERGRDALLRLVREYDVVLESFRPGVLDRLGVGYERMREENPGIVYCAIAGYGQDGPKRDASGHDMNYLGLIGLQPRLSWGPAVYNGEPERDLRVWAYERDTTLRLVINNPASIWGRAGLHSRDRLVSVNGAPLRTWPELRAKLQSLHIGDTVRVRVQRAQPFDATVIVAGFERPTVRIERLPNATVAQRRLAEDATF